MRGLLAQELGIFTLKTRIFAQNTGQYSTTAGELAPGLIDLPATQVNFTISPGNSIEIREFPLIMGKYPLDTGEITQYCTGIKEILYKSLYLREFSLQNREIPLFFWKLLQIKRIARESNRIAQESREMLRITLV